MRITGIKITPVAGVVAIIYAAFGLVFWITFALSSAPTYILPLGIVGPFFHFNVNFHLPRQTEILPAVALLVDTIAAYAATGWLTGAAAVVLFNCVARFRGGIRADFLSLTDVSVANEERMLT